MKSAAAAKAIVHMNPSFHIIPYELPVQTEGWLGTYTKEETNNCFFIYREV